MTFPVMTKIKFLLFLSLFLSIGGCRKNAQTITIFAASSLTDAFDELATAFEAANPETEVLLNFAGSSQLAAQLREGVAGDLFASANDAQMQAVIGAGRVAQGSARPFATNRLTVIVPADNPANIKAFKGLAQPDVQLILAVRGVPVREYTDQVVAGMSAENFPTLFYNNLVSEEDNVRVVVAKVALGEADAGIVYVSDVTADLADRVLQIPIPPSQNVIATYPIAPLTDAPNPELAERFIGFVLSPAGQEILARWGLSQ